MYLYMPNISISIWSWTLVSYLKIIHLCWIFWQFPCLVKHVINKMKTAKISTWNFLKSYFYPSTRKHMLTSIWKYQRDLICICSSVTKKVLWCSSVFPIIFKWKQRCVWTINFGSPIFIPSLLLWFPWPQVLPGHAVDNWGQGNQTCWQRVT